MESKINYTIVGIFVVILLTGLLSLAYWLQQHGGKQEYDYYHVYMSESIAGLSPDASVKYKGVEVGTVNHIEINPENSEQIILLLKVKHGTPVKIDAKAALKFFGITGLAYIELTGSSKNSPPLKIDGTAIPVIPSIPSTYAEIDDSLRNLSVKSIRALDKFDRLTSDKNLKNVEDILEQTKLLTQQMKIQLNGIGQLVKHSISMEKSMTLAFDKMGKASTSVDNMANSLQKNYAHVGSELNENVEQSLEGFDHLINQMNNLTNELQNTVRTIDKSPSDLLFKHTEIKPGPGEHGYDEK